MRIGFVGLGVMGTPMAYNLIAGGHTAFVHTRSKVPKEILGAGAKLCATAAEVAAAADVVFLMLPDTQDVEKCLFGAAGVLLGLTPGKTIVDMSSISPIQTKDFAARIELEGCNYLDAPVSGGEVGAKEATLAIMVGGKSEIFDQILPLLALMGKRITHVGEVGAGQIAKVANQMIVALTIAAVAEALVFASKAGADPARVRQALLGGFAGSRILEVHGERMIRRAFSPGFRIALHRKDLRLALQGASSLGMSMPLTAGAAQLMEVMQAQGWDQLDHAALVKSLELMADHELVAEGRLA